MRVEYDPINVDISNVQDRIMDANSDITNILMNRPEGSGVVARELALARTKLDEARLWLQEAKNILNA